MTIQEAKGLRYGDHIYDISEKNRDGTARRYKVNGKPQTWKTRPEEVRVPLKWGLYSYLYMTEKDLGYYSISSPDES